jgi:membrane protease subunit HflC
MNKLAVPLLLLGALAVLVVSRAAYVVDEAEQAIIVQFGEPIGDVVSDPGLHWRMPFIQEVRRFD